LSRIDRYLIGQLLLVFAFFSLVLVSVYWLNQAVRLFDRLIGDGQTAAVFLEFTLLALPNVMRLVLPVAAFAAALWVINRLGNESELVAVQTAGASAMRLARPVALFGLMVTAMVLVLNHFVVPLSRGEIAARRTEIDRVPAARFLSPGRFMTPAAGVTVYLAAIERDGTLRDIFLRDARGDGAEAIYTAERARLVAGDPAPRLVMFEGAVQTLSQESRRLSLTRFERAVYDTSAIAARGRARRPAIEELATAALIFPDERTLAGTGRRRAALLAEGHARIAQPFLALAGPLVALGALLSAGFSRFGPWRQIVLAIAVMVALHVVDNGAADLARLHEGLWPAIYGAPLLGLMAGVGLCRLADHPPLLAPAPGREGAR